MAYMSFHPATENDMPTSESKAIYRQLMATLTTVKDSERGYVPATTAQMSDDEGEAAAELIWDLRSQLSSWVKDNPNKGW